MPKVLIVDDSLFMRRTLRNIVSKDSSIEVVGEARDGQDALQKVVELDPDVITLDVEMPRMDGLATLKELMRTKPTPVIMISSLTEEGAVTTLKAMEYGAMDFLPKSLSSKEDMFAEELVKRIKVLARKKAFLKLRYSSSLKQEAKTEPKNIVNKASSPKNFVKCVGKRDIVAIGVSTGGPPVVQKILAALPSDFRACILIAQHMPAAFTEPFAKRLDSTCSISVSEAKTGDKLKPGHAYVAPGGMHTLIEKKGALFQLLTTPNPTSALYKPSANVLIESVANLTGRKSLGVILTGMGNDGLEGIKCLKEKGGYILAQSEESCVVYGMPKAIVDANLADQILDANQIANALMVAVNG